MENFLETAVKNDAKLSMFIKQTLNDYSLSESSSDDGGALEPETNSSLSVINANPHPEEENVENKEEATEDKLNLSLSHEVSFYFAKPTVYERRCVATHVKRLKREVQLEASRKTKKKQYSKSNKEETVQREGKKRQFAGRALSNSTNLKEKIPRRISLNNKPA